jgi:hypothetical protein
MMTKKWQSDQVSDFLNDGDLDGLRKFIEAENAKLEK